MAAEVVYYSNNMNKHVTGVKTNDENTEIKQND